MSSPEDFDYDQQLRHTLAGINHAMQGFRFPAEAGSVLHGLDATLEVPIPISEQLLVAVRASSANLEALYNLGGPKPASPWVTAPLARSVLVSACRILFVLLPQDPAQREINAAKVAKANALGYKKLVTAMVDNKDLVPLIPPGEVVQEAVEAVDKIPGKNIPEGAMLEKAVESVVTLLRTAQGSPVQGDPVENLAVLGEHVKYMFNAFSGLTHGLAWVKNLPGPGPVADYEVMPGDWPADLLQLASLVHLAADKLAESSRATHREG